MKHCSADIRGQKSNRSSEGALHSLQGTQSYWCFVFPTIHSDAEISPLGPLHFSCWSAILFSHLSTLPNTWPLSLPCWETIRQQFTNTHGSTNWIQYSPHDVPCYTNSNEPEPQLTHANQYVGFKILNSPLTKLPLTFGSWFHCHVTFTLFVHNKFRPHIANYVM